MKGLRKAQLLCLQSVELTFGNSLKDTPRHESLGSSTFHQADLSSYQKDLQENCDISHKGWLIQS